MLDRYLLEHELGAGARGVVYRARHRDTGRLVAIKLSAAAGPAVGDETGQGAPKAARTRIRTPLVHANIRPVYANGRVGCLWYEVLQLIEGTDLRAHTAPGSLFPLPTVLSIGAQIADALHCAHECGVIHGDIKPANILFNPTTGRAVLTDFPSEFPVVCERGAQAYMAPECLRGDAASPASDQFSLAVMLYQLACGRHPFPGRTRPEIVSRTCAEPHTDIRVHVPFAPAALVEFFDRALAKPPRSRYRDAKELKQAIARMQAHVRGAFVCSPSRDHRPPACS